MRSVWACAALLGLGCASLVEQPGCTESAHYALLRSLADGAPTIDRYHWSTCDTSWFHGHFYTAKGPGLAFLSLPFYRLLQAAGLVWNRLPADAHLQGIPGKAVWPFTVIVVASSACLLFLLMRRLADEIAPGTGLVVAAGLSLGTMLLPYSTLYAAHVPAALLGFAAFAVLFRERRGRISPRRLVLAGALAELAVVVDLPMGIVAVALAAYAAGRRPIVVRLGWYAVGAVAGFVPLLAFDWWAFGSILHQPYQDTVQIAGQTGHDQIGANANGLFGIGVPSLNVAARLLLLNHGLLVATPVVACALAGLVLLARDGFRAEALAITALVVLYLVYDSGYWLPFGGDAPGPRLLVPILPFLSPPLALVARRFAAAFAGLAAVSVVMMVTATVTQPMLEADDTTTWFTRFAHGAFQDTLLTRAGVGGQAVAVAPTLLLFAALIAIAAVAARAPRMGWSSRSALVALCGWAVVASVTPWLLSGHLSRTAGTFVALAVLAVAGGVSGALVLRAAAAQASRSAAAASSGGTALT